MVAGFLIIQLDVPKDGDPSNFQNFGVNIVNQSDYYYYYSYIFVTITCLNANINTKRIRIKKWKCIKNIYNLRACDNSPRYFALEVRRARC